MKELEYPFDSGYLLKKKRSIKRQLLSDGSVRIKKKIAVLGGSTTNDIINMLELFLLNYGIERPSTSRSTTVTGRMRYSEMRSLTASHPTLFSFIHQTAIF